MTGIRVEFRPGIEQITSRISSLPPELINEVLDVAGEYAKEVLAKYPRQKYVSRKSAYGVSFFTEKQRRWFFANLNAGNISVPYERTGGLGRGWQIRRNKSSVMITNDSPGSMFVMGEEQSRHEEKVGWKKASKIISGELTFRSSKFREMIAKAYQAVIRKLKIGT